MTDFYTALKANKLPAISYLKAPAYQDGHPGNSDPVSEQTFLVDVINAVQQSKDWKDTAIFISYDDTDGWYDHVTGPVVNQTSNAAGTDSNQTYNANNSYIPTLPLSGSTAPASPGTVSTSGVCGKPVGGSGTPPRCGYGIRLPFLAISPWAKQNFVDHTVTDQTSLLNFIEYNWNLGFIDGPTAPPAGTASFDRVAGSVVNMFDFSKAHTKKVLLDDSTGEVTN